MLCSALLTVGLLSAKRVPPHLHRQHTPRAVSPTATNSTEPLDLATAPLADALADEQLLRIVTSQTTDAETNELAWRCLGYVRSEQAQSGWDGSAVFPKWRKKYPQPPDLIGVTRTYSREVDEPVLRAVQALQQSVAREHKGALRPTLKPLGWSGFKLAGLTPNMTRRAQVATWLLYYRRELMGYSLEELIARREERAAAEALEQERPDQSPATGTTKQSVV